MIIIIIGMSISYMLCENITLAFGYPWELLFSPSSTMLRLLCLFNFRSLPCMFHSRTLSQMKRLIMLNQINSFCLTRDMSMQLSITKFIKSMLIENLIIKSNLMSSKLVALLLNRINNNLILSILLGINFSLISQAPTLSSIRSN